MSRTTLAPLALLLVLTAGGCPSEPAVSPSGPPVAELGPTVGQPVGDGVPGAPGPGAVGDPCGGRIDLADAFWNPRCGVSEEAAGEAARGLVAGSVRLRGSLQSATVVAGGELMVTLTLTATQEGTRVALFPRRNDDFFVLTARHRGTGQRYSVRTRVVYPPGFAHDMPHRHHALVALDPGSVATLMLQVELRETRHGPPDCPPNAKCPPEIIDGGPLPKGSYDLVIAPNPFTLAPVDVEGPLTFNVGS